MEILQNPAIGQGSPMKSDLQLQEDVIKELKWQPSVNAANIGVEVHEGVVTLSGNVASYAEKVAAERATQRIVGVKALTIDIHVILFGEGRRSDIDIARSAEEALRWVTYMPKESVKVMVESGWITLSGEVQWDYQRRNAVDCVRHLSGVKGVSDIVRLKSESRSNDIKLDIEAALDRRDDARDQNISVSVHDGAVTLSGTVTNWWQLDSAREAAWNTPGVQQVANRLAIVA
jgi:osmotically-inducible protein OsmY